MIGDLFNVLTCSNVTCPAPPLWYERLENFAAHGFIGAAVALVPIGAARVVLWALFAFKEMAFDFPNDPRLPVAVDCFSDLVAMVATTQIILAALHHRAGNLARKPWPPNPGRFSGFIRFWRASDRVKTAGLAAPGVRP